MTVWLFFDGGLRVVLVVVRLGEASGGIESWVFWPKLHPGWMDEDFIFEHGEICSKDQERSERVLRRVRSISNKSTKFTGKAKQE